MDPDPKRRAGGGRGSKRRRGKQRRGRREGEERRDLPVLFLRGGDEGALASSSPLSRRWHVGSESGSIVQYKQITIKAIIINTAGLLISDTHKNNQFANEPEGLRHFRDHRWKALGEENPILSGFFLFRHYFESYIE